MTQKFTDNARALLTGSLAAAATSMVIEASKCDRFPIGTTVSWASTLDWFKVVAIDASGNREVIYVGNRGSGVNTLSNLLRGQEGTTARDFPAGSSITLSYGAQDIADTLAAINKGHGQCVLILTGGNLVLKPHKGNKLSVGGANYTVPAVGVSLASPAVASTTYNIYAYISGGAIALEKDVATHTLDATTGVEVKSGDPSRTLVGQARSNASGVWVNSETQRFVRSWFNEEGIIGAATLGVNSNIGTTPWTEINGSYRAELLTWVNERVNVTGSYAGYDAGSPAGTLYGAVGADGVVYGRTGTSTGTAMSQNHGNSFGAQLNLSEGYHYLQIMGGNAGGNTPIYYGGYTGLQYSTARHAG